MFVDVGKKMRWCTVSETEQRKCAELSKALVAVLPPAAVAAFARLSCVRASSTADCIDKIRVRSELSPLPLLQNVSTVHSIIYCLFACWPLSPYPVLYPHPPNPSVLEQSFTHLSSSIICCLTDFLSGNSLTCFIMITNLLGFL